MVVPATRLPLTSRIKSSPMPLPGSWPKSLAVFERDDESLDHLRTHEVAAKLVQLTQPEVVTAEVCVWRIVRVASHVAKVLHQHKRFVELRASHVCILSYSAQHRRTLRRV